MRKTNLNLKRARFAKRLIIFPVIQALFAAIFVIAFNSNAPVNTNEIQTSLITVEKIECESKFLVGEMTTLTSNGVEYHFPKFPVVGTNEYSMHELYESIRPGDTLVVSYVDRNSRSSPNEQRTVLDARSETQQFRSFEAYNRYCSKQRVTGIIICSIVEFVFLICFTFFVVHNLFELKFFQHRKRKKKTKNSPTQK